MLTTRQAVEAGFRYEEISPETGGFFSFSFGEGYKLAIEPLIPEGYYVALYQDGFLILREKVPFLPIGEGLPPSPVASRIAAMLAEDWGR